MTCPATAHSMYRLLVILLVLASSCCSPFDKRDWSTELSGKHFVIKSTANEDIANQHLYLIDLVFETCSKLLNTEFPNEKRQTLVALLFDNKNEYLHWTNDKTAEAYYDPYRKGLVGHCDHLIHNSKSVLAHEATHAFLDVVSKDIWTFPPWFVEGLAECVASCKVCNNKLLICIEDSYTFIHSGASFKTFENEFYSLETLINMSWQEFWKSNLSVFYPQAYALCYFLLTFSENESTYNKIQAGKYCKNLVNFYQLICQNKLDYKTAWNRAFHGISLELLAKEWKQFTDKKFSNLEKKIKGTSEGDIIGFDCLDPLLETRGLFVMTVFEGGLYHKQGVKPGDIIIEINSKRFKRGQAKKLYEDIYEESLKKGTIKLTIIRNGKKIILTISFGKD